MVNLEEIIEPLYSYNAYVIGIYDGDTITCDIDVGFDIIIKKQKIRLYGIDTPELRGDERDMGLIIRDKLREKILHKWVLLCTIKDTKGKYGRWLGIIKYDNININQWLLDDPNVKEYLL